MHGTPPLQSANSKKIGVGRAPASGRKHRGPVDVALRVHLANHHPFQYALCFPWIPILPFTHKNARHTMHSFPVAFVHTIILFSWS